MSFKTSLTASIEEAPKRFYIQMRFFSFPEIQSDTVSLVSPGEHRDTLILVPGMSYFFAKEQIV